MILHGDSSLWTKNTEINQTYPSLSHDIKTDIIIVGGGICGALTAHYAIKQGLNCMLVEKNYIADQSTNMSTAILKYDTPNGLQHLLTEIGEHNAQAVYLFGYQAVMEIGQIVKEINSDCQFAFKPSFLYTENPQQRNYLTKECQRRQAIGIHCELFTYETHQDDFSFNFDSGIYSHYGSAIMNPVKFTKDLISYNVKKGLQVFEKTEIVDYNLSARQSTLITSHQDTITADKVIICNGYNALNFFKQEKPFWTLERTFSIVTKPVDNISHWKEECILYNDEHPQTYLRPNQNGSIIINGENLAISSSNDDVAMMGDRSPLALEHYHHLLRSTRKMFPHIESIKTDSWCHGVSINTKDDLPFIGQHPDYPGAYFNLGYGANGILSSLIGAKLISQDIIGRHPKELEIFKFNRY